MKKYLSLALALVLLFACGMQIAAADVSPYVACMHENYTVDYRHQISNIRWLTSSRCIGEATYVDRYTCSDCGYIWVKNERVERFYNHHYELIGYVEIFGSVEGLFKCPKCGHQVYESDL